MRPGLRRKLNPFIEPEFIAEQIERAEGSVRAMVEHRFRVLKRQFGYTKVRYLGLKKNTAQIVTLFALFNPWMGARAFDQSRGKSASAAAAWVAWRAPSACKEPVSSGEQGHHGLACRSAASGNFKRHLPSHCAGAP